MRRPACPDSYSEHMKLMFDLQVLALESDMTRVISFKTGRDAQNRVFPESGSNQPFHPASHHGNREERIMEFNKICKFRVSQLAYFLERMKTTMDGEASLLDKTLIIFGLADGRRQHSQPSPLPAGAVRHANGMLKGNLHLKAADATPMANVMLTLMHNLGLDDLQDLRRQHRRVLAGGADAEAGRNRRFRADGEREVSGGPSPFRRLRMRSSETLGAAAMLASGDRRGAAVNAPVADAPRAGDRDAVRTLLKDGADVNAPQGDGMTALHWAAERGDLELTEHPDLRRRQRRRRDAHRQYTPLHIAARRATPPWSRR